MLMLRLLAQWFLSAVSVTIVAKFLPGFRVATFGSALAVAAVYGILQVLLYRLLAILAFIPMILTFGLFALVIHTFLLWLTNELLEDFKIDSLTTTFIAAVLLTLLNGLWGWLLR
jgi:putative membrane protein